MNLKIIILIERSRMLLPLSEKEYVFMAFYMIFWKMQDIYDNRKQTSDSLKIEDGKVWDRGITENQEMFGGDKCVPCLEVVMCTWVYPYVKTYQLVNYKYVQFWVCQLYPLKLFISNSCLNILLLDLQSYWYYFKPGPPEFADSLNPQYRFSEWITPYLKKKHS